MLRKLILLALAGGAGAAVYFLRGREDQELVPATAGAPVSESAAEGEAPEQADTVESDAVLPDTSADPLVRREENAAAAAAGAIGGRADTVKGEADPAMRPVVEGSGDAEETFEETEDIGR
ncbi:MAG: hypothetical protein QOD53_2214 [Thermoleophilaceae bacterium]|jgi:hypothetical protein|nr:hypothetical protein [Thermoleophilaceae bacterium]